MKYKHKIAVVIPCYKVVNQILAVLNAIDSRVDRIYLIDDACPEKTGEFVKLNFQDERLIIISHKKNTGVGGAVITGYKQALIDEMDIIVKIDGDGQMDPGIMNKFISPIIRGEADYTKGSRFYNIFSLEKMPLIRKIGNAGVSFLNKLSSGYWNIMDPANGYTAIHKKVLSMLPLGKINERYFFESDMLFRLGIIRAVVIDIPSDAQYGNETSNLKIRNILFSFLGLYFKSFIKRIIYNYFLRDFNIASLHLLIGFPFFIFGIFIGITEWFNSINSGQVASTGTVMLSALPIILGFQLLLNAMTYDVTNIPRDPLQKKF